MNCDGIREFLSESQPLTVAAELHLASCAGCRAMLQALTPPQEEPNPKHIREIQSLITASLAPVRPLPSNRKLVCRLLVVFAAFSLLATLPVGYKGFHVLNTYQKVTYYGLLLVFAVWFSITIVQEMIPGSKRQATSRWPIMAAMIGLALLIYLLFQDFDTNRFGALGIPCLRLGCICALLSGALFWLICRKGFLTSPVTACASVGFFAGLAGVSVLALHCPIENSAHIIVWHLGAMLLAGLGGTVIGGLHLAVG